MTSLAPPVPVSLARDLAALRQTGYESRSVKQEIRANLIDRLRAGQPTFPGIVGFEETVGPQLERALLAGHDVVLLGERGQGKTRLIRSLSALLDEWTPVVEGCEINDDPTSPICARCRRLSSELGDDLPITWRHRSERFGEKLATPDTSVGDLIGDVDPVKVAEGRSLGDHETIHYGLVPRTNRGIFAINELPDLAERIQVALLNVLEERDIQVRGYKIQLPLDVVMVASANPEDYTNRGRLITPLKDRFGSQIRTHYPLDVDTETEIILQEADVPDVPGIEISVTAPMTEIIATFSQLARQSPHINQRSGVSVRLSVSNYEVLVANALQRALRSGASEAVPRICDLEALPASTAGKVEIETLEDGRDGQIIDHLVRAAVLSVFRERVRPETLLAVVEAFEGRDPVECGEDVPDATYVGLCEAMPPLAEVAHGLVGERSSAARVASAVEFVLEGLHLSKRLNKEAVGGRAQYRARG